MCGFSMFLVHLIGSQWNSSAIIFFSGWCSVSPQLQSAQWPCLEFGSWLFHLMSRGMTAAAEGEPYSPAVCSRLFGWKLHQCPLFVPKSPPPAPAMSTPARGAGRAVKRAWSRGDEKQELSESVVCSGWAVIPSGKADAVPDLTLWSLLEGRWVWDSTDDLPPGPSRVDGQWWIGLRYDVLPQNTCGTQLPSLLLLESHHKKRVSSYFGSDPVKKKKNHNTSGEDGIVLVCWSDAQQTWSPDGHELVLGICSSAPPVQDQLGCCKERCGVFLVVYLFIYFLILLNASILAGKKEYLQVYSSTSVLQHCSALIPRGSSHGEK